MNRKAIIILPFLWLMHISCFASYLLIPMDESQSDHLKAYGIAFWSLENEVTVDWLLNYRGGSFMIKNQPALEKNVL
mgnify:FL=1